MTIEDIKFILKNNLEHFDDDLFKDLNNYKKNAISENNEERANELWLLEHIFIVKKLYISAYNDLFENKYRDSWEKLEGIEICLNQIAANFNDEVFAQYNLNLIRNNVYAFQKLFPYFMFASRESVILEEKCSICGKKITLRNTCNHKVGKLYMGEMCYRIIERLDLKAIALVTNPFDKYAVLTPADKEYNYYALEELKRNILGPYEKIDVIETMILKPQYKGVGRNEKCPCGSGLKYKKCCLGTKKELMVNKCLCFSHKMKSKETVIINSFK